MPTNDINFAVSFAVDFCNNETHGYSNGNVRPRAGSPDTDCSGLVYLSLQAGGFDVPTSMWYTGNMMEFLRTMGFTEYIYMPGHYSDYTPQHGDICVHREGTPDDGHGHALFYAENVLGFVDKYTANRTILPYARVEAVSDYNGQPGDSQYGGTGAYHEVWVHQASPLYSSYIWHVFRWGGAPGPTPVIDPEEAAAVAAMLLAFGKRRKRKRGYYAD